MRPGDDKWANSVVALRAKTGQMAWGFQLVHHDLWDYDTAAPPLLATVMHDGKKVDVVVQGNKTGFLYVLNRDNMGHFQSGSDSQIIQEFPRLLGRNSVDDQFFGIGAYWNTNVYFVGAFDNLKQFKIALSRRSNTWSGPMSPRFWQDLSPQKMSETLARL